MAGSGDEFAAGAGDRNLLRASDADREQVIAALKAAFVAGRLTKDEFDLRITLVFASRTHADLAALTADIPARLATPQSPEPVREQDTKKLIQRGTAVAAGAGMVIPAAAIVSVGGPPALAVIFGLFLSSFLAVLVPGFLTLLSWALDRSSGSQPAQGPPPSARRKAHQPLASADPTGSPPPITPEPPHTAEAGRSRRSRPRLPSAPAPRRRLTRPAAAGRA